jgi:hypothetical protein
VLVYVDDLIIIRNNQIKIELIKKNLKQKIESKDLGKLKYFFNRNRTFKEGIISISKEICS